MGELSTEFGDELQRGLVHGVRERAKERLQREFWGMRLCYAVCADSRERHCWVFSV